MVKVTGKRAALAKLMRMGPEVERQVGRALFVGGEMFATEAQISITTGAVSGKNHIPSLPGEPPNNDSGVLANNIEVVQLAPLLVEVSSNAPYSRALEYGTSKMAERPFMRPAAAKTRKPIEKLLSKAISKAIGGKAA